MPTPRIPLLLPRVVNAVDDSISSWLGSVPNQYVDGRRSESKGFMASHKLGYIRGLDGLRALAIIGVLMFHLHLEGLMLGFTGVQLFFAISGFLITRILLSARHDDHPFRTFYIRRALRIFPIYYLFVLVVVLGHVAMGETNRLQSIPLFLTYTQNMSSAIVGTGPFAIAHTWSLAVEEQFYWLWPMAVLLMPVERLRYLIFVLFAAAPAWRFAVVATGASRYLTTGSLPSEMDSILAGAAIAVALHFGLSQVALRRIGWGAVVFGGVATLGIASSIGFQEFWWYEDWTGAGLGFAFLTAVAILCGGVVALVVAGVAKDILERKPLVWIGRVSYGIYLYHGLVFFLVNRAGGAFFAPLALSPLGKIVLMLLKIGLSFGLAAASWRYIEQPILRLKDRFTPMEAQAEPVSSRVS